MPDSFEEHFDRAKRALTEGWADQALVPATEAVKLAPSRADARVLLARAWLGNAGWARAISDATAALALGPAVADEAAAREAIGRASLKLGALGDAEAALREVRRLAPSPACSALLAGTVADAGRAKEAMELAREDAARVGEEWKASSVAFATLAVALVEPDAPAAAVPLAFADLFFDVGLREDAKARYQIALAKAGAAAGAADSLSERAADGLRALSAGEKSRPRPAVTVVAPSAVAQRTRKIRLLISGVGGAIAITTILRWQQLESYGVLRMAVALTGLSIVATCVVLARRDEVAARRAAEISSMGSGGPTT